MRIEIVNPAPWVSRIQDLLADNWAETGFDFDFDPDVDAYQRMYDAGVCFGVRGSRGDQTVGYCTVTVCPHPFSRHVVVASNDALFVRPEFRKGLLSGRLILAAEAEAKHRGARRFIWHCRAGTGLANVLSSHGCNPVCEAVMKEL